MTLVEAAKLLTLIAAAWPQFEPTEDKVLLWHELFADVSFEVAQAALKKLMVSSPFPPSIADLRREVVAVTVPLEDQISPAEAWGMVVHAIRKYGYYQEEKAKASLPSAVRRTVDYIGWQELCLSDEPDVIRAQFMRMYEQVTARQRQEALLPPAVKQHIASLAERMDMQRLDAKPRLRLIKDSTGEGERV